MNLMLNMFKHLFIFNNYEHALKDQTIAIQKSVLAVHVQSLRFNCIKINWLYEMQQN
jgi:hypothetical protein